MDYDQSKYIVPKDCANFIYNLAPLSFISSIIALYRGHYNLFIVPLSVGCTTLLFWKEPTYGWRRNTDIIITSCGLLYQIYRVYLMKSPNILYYFIKFLAVLSYVIGHYHYSKGRIWLSTYCHSGIHIFGNLGNIVLYVSMESWEESTRE